LEALKVGECTPPILTRHGWLILYHGISFIEHASPGFSFGIMLLDKDDPHIIHYRSSKPVLSPPLATERFGRVSNVVFPTGIDRRDDLGMTDRLDVCCGMADDRIGAARFDWPEDLVLEACWCR
jgi:beta-1,2-mannobiose phosphorylase / 1,2-beta-oligomannan phosphorylase